MLLHRCIMCQPILNEAVTARCILNGLFTKPRPRVLHPLSKQLIQRGKAFQAVVKLGGKVRKETIFNLLLPLDKTLQTIENVKNGKNVDLVA